MVLMSESIDGLQNMLNAMSRYLNRFLISCLGPLVLFAPKTLNYLAFQYLDIERT